MQHGPICLDGPVSRSRSWWRNHDSGPDASCKRPEEGSEEMRLDLIARVKSEIAAGRYDTPEKLQIALDRMLDNVE